MADFIEGMRLTVYLSEDDRVGDRSAAEELLELARQQNMGGATLWRGAEGLGASRQIRVARLTKLRSPLPQVLEVIDLPERIEGFMPTVHNLVPGALMTQMTGSFSVRR